MRSSSVVLALLACLGLSAAQVNYECFSNDAGQLELIAAPEKLVFNQAITTKPAAIAYCSTEQQVVNALRCAKLGGLKAVPRGGGHGYQGYAVPSGSVVIDVTNLTSFTVDKAANTATFGPGLRLGQLYLEMYLQANSLFPAGTCPWVGTPGHLLGGGTGLSVRKYGMACDQIVSLNMVDYQGNVLTASNTTNTDLLWASCGGGGGNLGIVTSFTVKLNSLDDVPVVTVGRLSWGYEHAVDVFDKVQRWAPTADRRMGAQILIGFGGANLNLQFEGPQADYQAAVDASGVLDIPGITLNDVVQESWVNATLLWASESMGISDTDIYALNMSNGLPAGQNKSFQAASSYNQQPMSREGIQGMLDAVTSLGSGDGTSGGYIEHKMLGGAVADPSPTATAFYWRTAIFETQYFYYWSTGDNGPANSWLSSVTQALKPYVGQGNYINYPDPLLAATTSWPTAYYGGNLQAYTDVKTKYDPTNYFSNPLTVAPYTNSSAVTPATSSAAALRLPVLDQRALSPATAASNAPGRAPASAASLPVIPTTTPPLAPATAPLPATAATLPTSVASAG